MKRLTTIVLALILAGCASTGAVYWERGETGGPPASWPCQATG